MDENNYFSKLMDKKNNDGELFSISFSGYHLAPSCYDTLQEGVKHMDPCGSLADILKTRKECTPFQQLYRKEKDRKSQANLDVHWDKILLLTCGIKTPRLPKPGIQMRMQKNGIVINSNKYLKIIITVRNIYFYSKIGNSAIFYF